MKHRRQLRLLTRRERKLCKQVAELLTKKKKKVDSSEIKAVSFGKWKESR